MKYNNVIFLGLCLGLTTYSALSADSVIKISGRVLDYGCTVSSDSLNFTVDLQKNSARQFPTTGSTSPAVPFQITLSECSKGTTGVRVAFNGIEDAENNTLLKLDEGSNTASGLGIEILDGNMRPVKLNDLHTGMQWIPLVPEQNNILPYSARLKSTQKSVNPGLVSASATFISTKLALAFKAIVIPIRLNSILRGALPMKLPFFISFLPVNTGAITFPTAPTCAMNRPVWDWQRVSVWVKGPCCWKTLRNAI